MDAMGDRVSVEQNLSRSADVGVGMRWPHAIDTRFDTLIERAVLSGERTSRKEILAALIFATDLDGDALGALLRAYRVAKVRDAFLDATPDDNVVQFRRNRPGPRPRDH